MTKKELKEAYYETGDENIELRKEIVRCQMLKNLSEVASEIHNEQMLRSILIIACKAAKKDWKAVILKSNYVPHTIKE